MAFNVNTFFTRLGSAVVFTAIVLAALLWNEWAFIGLFFVVNFLCLREYTSILEKILGVKFSRNEKANFIGLGISFYLLVISFVHLPCENMIASIFRQMHFYFLGLVIGFLILFFSFRKNKKSIYLLTGISYISLALGLLVHLRFISLVLPVMLIFFIWMNDTMAYLTGSFLGRTPFFPKISPKKTLEGTIGGILFAMAFAWIWGANTQWFPIWQWVVIGLIASLCGTLGDLAESKLKRMAGIKDSGTLMPGHGGALDRFDSLLFAAPFAYLFAMIAMSCLQMKVF
jgi:phosphatidate cytidylyltransferase